MNEKKTSDPLELDEIIKKLEEQRQEAADLSAKLETNADALEQSSEATIHGVAEDLVKLRKAAGLPDKDVDELKEGIRSRQRDLASGTT
jgi:uncharacterized protein YlxW (UPF0749 family)